MECVSFAVMFVCEKYVGVLEHLFFYFERFAPSNEELIAIMSAELGSFFLRPAVLYCKEKCTDEC